MGHHQKKCYVVVVVVAVWVVCFGKVDDADAKMNWMAGLAWHTETHIRRTQCMKARKEKEVNCRLLSENESVCRKRHSRPRLD